jgi:sortase A
VTQTLEPSPTVIKPRRSQHRWRGRPRVAPKPVSENALVVLRIVLTFGLLIVWVLGYLLGVSRFQEARHQHVLYSNFREELAAPTAPVGATIAPGDPVALLDGPRGLLHDEVVIEGTTSGNLRNGPGHVRSTPLPGQQGVSLLYGRATTYGGPFGDLPKLRPGDNIDAVTGQGTFHYRVADIRHAGDPLPVAPTSSQSRLTLVSVTGASWRNAWSPHELIYVDATLQGIVAPTPPGRPTAIMTSERALGTDAGPLVLMSMVLWLQGLLIALVAMAWARSRWGRQQSWLVGVPVVLAMVWGLTTAATGLLPNLI